MADLVRLHWHQKLEVLRADAARERVASDQLGVRVWHARNRSRRAMARAYWARAAASVMVDDVKIARLEKQLLLTA